MKQLLKTSMIVGLFLILSSFTNNSDLDFIGTYGSSENDPANIKLKLNADKTFTYTDFSNTKKKVDVNGNYVVKNNTIYLKNYLSDVSFHTKWKITKDGKMAKSRKGITYYSLEKKQ